MKLQTEVTSSNWNRITKVITRLRKRKAAILCCILTNDIATILTILNVDHYSEFSKALCRKVQFK